jgi:hypothetical protein
MITKTNKFYSRHNKHVVLRHTCTPCRAMSLQCVLQKQCRLDTGQHGYAYCVQACPWAPLPKDRLERNDLDQCTERSLHANNVLSDTCMHVYAGIHNVLYA